VLNREYIAAVALALIDKAGLVKFSMRKLGSELGVDPMAVYRHFEDQEALFDGIAEALFEELDVDALPWQGPGESCVRSTVAGCGTPCWHIRRQPPSSPPGRFARPNRLPPATR
jgi:AcrR family transcriptional regulator